MSLAINAQTVAAQRYTKGQLRSKKRVLGLIASAWDELHRGTCGFGKGERFVEPIERLTAKELALRFFRPTEIDANGSWLYAIDPSELVRL